MKQLWRIYHREIPEFLREFMEVPTLLRLREVGMNCGCEYTNFPRFRGLQPYSRYDHSVGCALIVWHFTESREQTLAALFHDVTTPVFAHVVDFLNGDHLRQESTEAGIAEMLKASDSIHALLKKYDIALERITDYHCYPIADNDAPALSADRLEYTMGNLLNYGFAGVEELRTIYHDLMVGVDENGRPELAFDTPQIAVKFAHLALKNSHVYVADEDRFAMESLAGLLREAIERGVLSRDDLMTTESRVIELLKKDSVTITLWKRFCGYAALECSAVPQEGANWISVAAKKRWIDPMVQGKGRVSAWDKGVCREITAFRSLDFSHWMRAI